MSLKDMSLAGKRLSVAVVASVGTALAAAIAGTIGRLSVTPTTANGTVEKVMSHAVDVSKPIEPGTGQDVEAAGGQIFQTQPRPIGPKPKYVIKPRTTAAQRVQVTVRVSVSPSPLRQDSDAEVQISVRTNVAPTLRDRVGQETVRLESESFKVRPAEPRLLDLTSGEAVAHFVITPNGPGDKMLRVFAKHIAAEGIEDDLGEHEEVSKVSVTPASRSFIGVDEKIWTSLQAVGSLIGLPGLLLLVVTRRLDARKKEKRRSRRGVTFRD